MVLCQGEERSSATSPGFAREQQLPGSRMILITAWQEGLSFVPVTANEDRHDTAESRGLDVRCRVKHRVPTQGPAGRKPVSLSLPLGPFFIHDSSPADKPPTSQCQLRVHLLPRLRKVKVNFLFVVCWVACGVTALNASAERERSQAPENTNEYKSNPQINSQIRQPQA